MCASNPQVNVVQRRRCWILAVHWHLIIVTLAAAAATHCVVRRVAEPTATRRRASWRSPRRARRTASSRRRASSSLGTRFDNNRLSLDEHNAPSISRQLFTDV